MRNMSWDEYFIRHAMLVSEKSKDPSTKVGCILVGEDNEILSTGFNGFPRGISETVERHQVSSDGLSSSVEELISERWDRPEKYKWTEHAERNAIYNAARNGIKLKGARAYLNWEPIPCTDCTRALIQSGIVEIIGPNIPFGGVGAGTHYHLNASVDMIKESGIKFRTVEWRDNESYSHHCNRR